MGLLGRARKVLEGAVATAEQIAPEWGLRREYARHRAGVVKAQGYSQHGASRQKNSMKGWVTATGGPDSDITLNLELLRQRSRDLCMGEPLAIGALKTIRVNEIGSGLRVDAQIDHELLGLTNEQKQKWERHTEREFQAWTETVDCDAARRFTFGELQALARLSELVSGDVFALMPSIERPGDRYDLKLQLLEADRVSNPWPYPQGKNVLGGVEVGSYGEPLAYYVAKTHPGDLFVPGYYGTYADSDPSIFGGAMPAIAGPWANKWERVLAFGDETGRRMVLHIMEADRPGQRRGVPILAPVMERLKQLGRYHDAELTAAVVSGFFTAAITSELPTIATGQVLPPQDQVQNIDPTSPANGGREDQKPLQLGPGTMLGLDPGEKFDSVNPARPNSGFDPFVKACCRYIAAGLPGMTYGLFVKEFNASYSASRAELLEAWKSFVVGRRRHATRLCQPYYEQWLEEAVLRGYIKAPGFFSDPLLRAAWCRAEWSGPAQGQLDPTKEVAAAEARVAGGFSTRGQETAAMTGGNFERNHTVRVREEQMRRDGQVIALPQNIYPTDPAAAGFEPDPNAPAAVVPKETP